MGSGDEKFIDNGEISALDENSEEDAWDEADNMDMIEGIKHDPIRNELSKKHYRFSDDDYHE